MEKNDEQELIVHIANYSFPKPGFRLPFKVDKYSSLTREYQNRLSIDVFIIGALMMMGLYHIGIYITRPTEKTALFLGVTCLAACLFSASTGTMIIYNVISGLSGVGWWYLFFLGWYVAMCSFICFTCIFNYLFIYICFYLLKKNYSFINHKHYFV